MIEPRPAAARFASLVGPTAARALRAGACGRVVAVFERSFYVGLDAGLIAIGPRHLGAGPLSLLCAPWPRAQPLSALVRCGDAAQVDATVLGAGALRFDCAQARPWRPELPDAWTAASLARGLAAATEIVRRRAPAAGLGRLGAGGGECRLPIVRAAQAPLGYLAQWLHNGVAASAVIDADAIAPLVGLGPGLTPSGDDYLGGMLVALAVIGRTGQRDRLWQALEPLLGERTVAISRAHLAAAAEGFGSAALHRALNAILGGVSDRLDAEIAALATLGHTSGLDALAGAIAVLRSV